MIGVLLFIALLLAGVGLGLFAWQADRVETTSPLNDLIRGLGNIPSPWLALAFVTGAVIGSRLWGTLSAATVLCLAVAAYYFAITVSGDREGIPLRGAMTGWLAVALLAGPVFGLAGAVWRRGPSGLRPFAVGLMSGALIGEVAFFGADGLRYGFWELGDTRTIFATADLLVALSLPLLLLSGLADRLKAYLTAGLMGGVALIAMVLLMQVMRDMFNA